MYEFWHFMTGLRNQIRFVRGVFAGLAAMLFILAVLFSWVESLPLGESLYFTMITGLTVGYGDIVPKTPPGRVLSIIIGFTGVLMTGLIVAMATRALAEAVQLDVAHRNRPAKDQ